MASVERSKISIGDRFGRLEVIETGLRMPLTPAQTARGDKLGGLALRCLCDCGTEAVVRKVNLASGSVVSCGCNRRERMAENRISGARIDGRTLHPRYGAWRQMMNRCYLPTHSRYPRYGGRGITVHEPWRDAGVFLAWLDANLGPCPPGMSLDRVDNDRGYEPGNLRWADGYTQARNREFCIAARGAA